MLFLFLFHFLFLKIFFTLIIVIQKILFSLIIIIISKFLGCYSGFSKFLDLFYSINQFPQTNNPKPFPIPLNELTILIFLFLLFSKNFKSSKYYSLFFIIEQFRNCNFILFLYILVF